MLFFTKSFIIIFFGIFCFIFSCLSFSSELSVKEVVKTQQEETNNLPLLTDKEYNAILDSIIPPSYYNFKRVLEYMDIASLKEYLDFLEELEIEHFPKSPKKYYGNQWEGWPQKKLGELSDSGKKLERKNKLSSYKSLSSKHQNKKPKKPSRVGAKKKDWMTFAEAQVIVQEAGIKTEREFREWNKAGKRPSNFPSNPAIKYKKDWKGWPHFLGREARGGKKKVSYKQWMSYEEARAFMQKEGIKTLREFMKWSVSGNRPSNFPSHPNIIYAEEWVSWPHFLGTEQIRFKKWMSYAEAQALMKEQGITSEPKFREWKRAGKRPANFPANPHITYKEEWVNWPHFFGTEQIRFKKWMTYAEAQVVVQEAGIKTLAEFREWSKAGNRPAHLPSDPIRIYKEEWVSWYHFLGTEKCKKVFK